MFFTIIVTAFNCEKYILETLTSIENQSFRNYEVIIVDDNSLDYTHEIITKFINNKRNWRIYSNNVNKGVVFSRNKAFSLAKGKYIAILDGDDVWEESKLMKQYEFLEKIDIDFCYTSYSFINENSEQKKFIYITKPVASYLSLLKENYIGCSTVVVKKSVTEQEKFNSRVDHEDYFYWLTLLKKGYRAEGLVEPLVRYRIHDGSRSYNKFRSAIARYKVYNKFEGFNLFSSIKYFLFYLINALKKYIVLLLKK